jgi:hypothetical protein
LPGSVWRMSPSAVSDAAELTGASTTSTWSPMSTNSERYPPPTRSSRYTPSATVRTDAAGAGGGGVYPAGAAKSESGSAPVATAV